MLGLFPLSGGAISALPLIYPIRVIDLPGPPAIVAPAPGEYDLLGAFDALLPGYFFQRADYDAMYAAYAANNYQPLTAAQALAAIVPVSGPQPAPLTGIRQLQGYDDAPLYFVEQTAGTIGGP